MLNVGVSKACGMARSVGRVAIIRKGPRFEPWDVQVYLGRNMRHSRTVTGIGFWVKESISDYQNHITLMSLLRNPIKMATNMAKQST